MNTSNNDYWVSVRLKPAEQGKVDVVFLYSDGIDGFQKYTSGPLPSGLQWSHVSRDVVAKLGEPSDKFGGGRTPCAISYETLGLDITFANRNWDDAANPLGFICIFKQVSQTEGLCSRCGKLATFSCGRCGARHYCGSTCQKADWPKHKAACEAHSQSTNTVAATPAESQQLGLESEAKPLPSDEGRAFSGDCAASPDEGTGWLSMMD